ncbi:MAG: O-antigen ligase domain-containing protein [Bacteroidia bacterium]
MASPLENIIKYVTSTFLALVLGLLVVKLGMVGSALFIVLPLVVAGALAFIYNPKLGIYILVFMAFAIPGLTRYFPGPPFGLTIDIFLVLTLLVVFLKDFKKLDFSKANNDLVWAWAIWMIFCIMMILNPLARSMMAWFYAQRGIAMYPLLMIPLVMLVFNERRDMNRLFVLIIIMEVFGSFWGMKQIFIGVSATENRWLMQGAASTHILFGKLRAFSYFTDAAQFGASQIHIAFMCFAYALGIKTNWKRILVIIGGLICFYGFMLSGSRGPLVIPAIAGFFFLLLSRYTTLFISGSLFGFMLFSFLKFTTIAQNNYNVARLRTALNPTEDESFLVRKRREAKVSIYLADKPLGGGIGSAGSWGRRFYPGTFLAEIGTDGHYTRIWMETGIIGLYVYLGVFIWIALRICIIVFRLKDPSLRFMVGAWGSSFIGLAVASYTNGLIVQVPTGPITYCGLAFVWMSTRWDRNIAKAKERETLQETENRAALPNTEKN